MKSSKEKRTFSSGSQRDSSDGKPRMELLPLDILERVAVWYAEGADKYGDNNWRMGQPQSAVVGSLLRHLSKWMRREEDEDHLSAVVWNALCLMNTDMYHSEDQMISDMKGWFKDGKPTGKGSWNTLKK